jgi:4-oxalocrotonate tautomerase
MPTVIIYWSPGRSAEQKERVAQQITDALVTHGRARTEDVLIIFQNIEPGDAARAGGMITPPHLQASEQGEAAPPTA